MHTPTNPRPPVVPDPVPAGLLLPPGAVLLHIGPHKTGTTAIQFAMHLARGALAARGVVYAGSRRHSVEAAQAVRGFDPTPTHARGLRQWRELVGDARRHRDSRIVVSSEWFAEATPSAIARIVEDLGPDRVHVVVTVRPLVAILPSQWQQYVQGGLTMPYGAWLDGVLNRTDRSVTRSFWLRHHLDELITRWAEVLGSPRVTVVIVDDRDRGFVLRAFEAMLGLPAETLRLHSDRLNRSLTWPEIEVVRRLNQDLNEAGVEVAQRLDLVLFGAAPALRGRQPPEDEPRIHTPPWAVDRAAEIAAEIADGIATSGVRVVGDLARLRSVPDRLNEWREPSPEVWPEVAVTALRGAMVRAGLLAPLQASDPAALPLAHVPARRLVAIVGQRLLRAAARRAGRAS